MSLLSSISPPSSEPLGLTALEDYYVLAQKISHFPRRISLFHYSSETCVMAFLASFASALSSPNANVSHINPMPGCWDPGWACASCSCVPAWLFLWCQELVNSGMGLQPPELPLNKWEPQRAQCHGAKFCPSAHPGAGTGGI